MIVFYDPNTLNVTHIVVHAPDEYKSNLKDQNITNWVETDEDIPPEEVIITKDKKIDRQIKVYGSDNKFIQNVDEAKEIALRSIDKLCHLDMEPYLIAEKYKWATSSPVAKAIEIESQILGMPIKQLISHIKHRYDEETVRLQWAEINRQKAQLAIKVAKRVEDINKIVSSFDPNIPVDGIVVVSTNDE